MRKLIKGVISASMAPAVLAGMLYSGQALAASCNGQKATIHVKKGKVVGGPLNGQAYEGILTGTDGADVIVGTNSVDVIEGLGGSDIICARRGNDTIAGDTIAAALAGEADTTDIPVSGDTLFGGRGADTIYGSAAADTIHAGRGNDTVMGYGGNDDIYGNRNNDTIHGGEGDDTIHGNRGQDFITGGPGNDSIYGNRNADTIDGGEGDDYINGGRGADELSGGPGTADVINGQRGKDNCDAETVSNCENAVELVIVADVVGADSADAQATLSALGLTSSVAEVFSDAAIGTVISQNPAAGEEVSAGANIELMVSKGPDPAVTVANVLGENVVIAEQTLEDLGLVTDISEVFDDAEAGTVLSQNPEAGALVDAGSVVALTVSLGPDTSVTVADVVGENVTAATQTLIAQGLQTNVTDVFDNAPVGTVLAQNPTAGTQVDIDSVVELTVSKGPDTIVSVLNVVGESVENATTALDAIGLNVNVTEVFDDAPIGTVLSQDPTAGQDVEMGTVVNLEVSKGPELLTTTIEGFITTPSTLVISNAQVGMTLYGGTSTWSTITSGIGSYAVEVPRDTQFVTTVSADGYTDQVIPNSSSTSGAAAQLNVVMKERGEKQTFNIDNDGTISGENGASVTVVGGSFVDSNGVQVNGNIEVTITPVDVSNPAELEAFPGAFMGVTDANTTTPIASYGTVEYVFTQNGEKLDLAPEIKAEIEIPIYVTQHENGLPIEVDDQIALWSLNESTGIWEQEGKGSVVASAGSPTGLALKANVSHFSWWNCDVSISADTVVVTVQGTEAGTATVSATTDMNLGFRPNTVDMVLAVGESSDPLFVPENANVCFSAAINYENGSSGNTSVNCIDTANGENHTVTLLTPVEGPLSISALPAPQGNTVTIDAYINSPIERVRFFPTTVEGDVSYSISSGALPNGVNLLSTSSKEAEIGGSPTQSGQFTAAITASSAGETDSITLVINIVNAVAPPEFQGAIFVPPLPGGQTPVIDLKTYNTGGPVSSWSIDYVDENYPGDVLLNPNGLITLSEPVPGNMELLQVRIEASNASGSVIITMGWEAYYGELF